MTSYNLAVCIGPTIFRSAIREETVNLTITLNVMILMIEQWDSIFDGEAYETDRVDNL